MKARFTWKLIVVFLALLVGAEYLCSLYITDPGANFGIGALLGTALSFFIAPLSEETIEMPDWMESA